MREYLSAIAKALAPAVAGTVFLIGVGLIGVYTQNALQPIQSVGAIGQALLFVGFIIALHTLIKD